MAQTLNRDTKLNLLTENELWPFLGLSAEYYWQEDADQRCTHVQPCVRDLPTSSLPLTNLLGKTLWDLGWLVKSQTSNGQEHQALRKKRESFSKLNCVLPAKHSPDGNEHHLHLHGHPRFDSNGHFIGYHCIAVDISQELNTKHSLNRFREAMDMSTDQIYLVDPDTLKFIDVNETACYVVRKTKEEMLEIGPADLIDENAQSIRERYNNLIEGKETSHFQTDSIDPEGNAVISETYSRASLIDGRWIIIGVTRNVTARQQSERKAQKLQQMYSALSETNAAILRARSADALFNDVCQAAIKGGKFSITTVLVPDEGSMYKAGASAGAKVPRTRPIRISTDPSLPEGQGIGAIALRTKLPCVSNDYMADERTKIWHDMSARQGSASMAAIPLLTKKSQHSVIIFNATEKDAFDDEIVDLLQSMAGNIAFALDDFKNEEARANSEKTLRESEERFRSLTQLSSDFYWEQDVNFRFTTYEGKIVGESNQHAVKQLLGNFIWEHKNIFPSSFTWEEFKEVLVKKERFRDFEFKFVNTEGIQYYFSLSGEPMFDEEETVKGYRGISKDITDKKNITDRIEYLATHDNLTKLPNRVMFSELLSSATKLAARYKDRAFAVLFIDLDRFKLVNDTYGHHIGDALLVRVAERLKVPLRNSDVVARLGGDEFVILLHELVEKDQISRIANSLLKSFIEPIIVDDRECRVTISIGISVYGTDAIDEETLMKHADVAMYVAKDKGKNNFQFYSRSIHLRTKARIDLEVNLGSALKKNELYLFYQPKLDIHTGKIAGAEALLRWKNPQLGKISPADFIPVAEENGLIIPIGEWVFINGCQQSRAWYDLSSDPFCLSINLSARQFNDPNLIETIKKTLKLHQLAPHQLELEITESTVINNPRHAINILNELKQIGLKISLDDFGTGYSSLGQLKHYPIDTLKIDRSFIKEIPFDNDDKALTKAIITMGKTLGMTVVAEGVETVEQLDFLHEHGCDQIQGFYFQKPLPANEFDQWYRSYLPASMKTLLQKK
jgi:diguanylate cyclase (GGDEF)-like protein/PAS domain S-box-containing protein